jgi:hypothetical protein
MPHSWAGGKAQVVERLPSTYKALGSIPIMTKKTQQKRDATFSSYMGPFGHARPVALPKGVSEQLNIHITLPSAAVALKSSFYLVIMSLTLLT